MDNKIKLIKTAQEQKNIDIVEPTKRKIITSNSPIIKRLREAEEKNKQHRLSDDELIELEFKEEADKIRAFMAKTSNENDSNSDVVNRINLKENTKNDVDSRFDYVKLSSNTPQTRNLYYESKKADSQSDFTKEMINEDTNNEDPVISINIQANKPIAEDFVNKRVDLQSRVRHQTAHNSSQHQEHNSTLGQPNRIEIKKQDSANISSNHINTKDSLQNSLENKIRQIRLNASRMADSDILANTFVPHSSNLQSNIALNNSHSSTYPSNQDSTNLLDSANIADFSDNNIDSSYSALNNKFHHTTQNEAVIQNIANDNIHSGFTLPPTTLLNAPAVQKVDVDGGEIDMKANNLFSKLRVFKINGDIAEIYSGPVVTTFEFRPALDVKVSRIQSLQDDLSMALMAKSIRIQAPIPGKDVVGIEIPNNTIQTIYIREIFESKEFVESSAKLAIVLGKDVIGRPMVADLAKLPHLLIAGTTGSGKSVGLNGMILSLLYKKAPKDLRFIMIDPKMVELSLYKDIPHLLTPIIADSKKAIIALSRAVDEMNKRFEMLKEMNVKDIEGYNAVANTNGAEKLPYIVIIIDEFADLMIMGGKDAERYLISLASKARASGIHLIIATQRPTVDVVTGLIKSNLPSRISYRVGSKTDSKVILDEIGADSLLGNGDLLFKHTNSIIRIHAPYSHEKEIERVADFIRNQQQVEYDDFFVADKEINHTQTLNTPLNSDEDYYNRAKEIILQTRKTSISYLQRSLGVGFNKAAGIIEQLEKEGFLSVPNSKGIREIIGEV